MLQFKICGVIVQFKFLFFAVIAVVLFTDGTGIAFWAFCASLMHEMGHVICFIICGQKPELIAFECSGIKLKEDFSHNTSLIQELFILSAGCGVNFIVYLLTHKSSFGNIAIVHLIIGIFNLLPILSLDGGKIILIILSKFLNYDFAYRIIKVISFLFCILLILIGFVLAYNLNFSLLATGIYLFITLLVEK